MILQSELLLSCDSVVHAFSLRENTSFAHGSIGDVLRAREAVLKEIGLSIGDLTLTSQVHGTGILRVRASDRGRGSMRDEDRVGPGDGLITDVPGLAVGVLVADCCCLLLAETSGKAVGAFHAGWRGTLAGIACRAVETMRSEFSIPPDQLLAWIGPAISGANYEVGIGIWRQFNTTWNHAGAPKGTGASFLLENPFRVDLKELNRLQLRVAGVREEAIDVSSLCTFEAVQCFSHRRRDSPQGRMLGVIARQIPSILE